MNKILTMMTLAFALSLPFEASVRAQDDPPIGPLPTFDKAIQKASEDARFQADRARAQLGEVQERLATIVRHGPEGPGQTVVVRSTDSDPKTQANLEEDLAVMSRILDKALSQNGDEDRTRHAMGINVLFGPGPSAVRNLYLEGYGALFMMNVGFPLLPPPPKTETPKEEPQKNSAWDDARRELYGQRFDRRVSGPPVEDYKAEKVSELKDALIEALKNGANIRDLKADDAITVCVFGGPNAPSFRYRTMIKRGPKAPSSATDVQEDVVRVDRGEPKTARGTLMTIKAKKANVDAFAAGKMTLEEFRGKASVTTTTCAAEGGRLGGVTSFGYGGGGGFGGGGGLGGGGRLEEFP
jgi:hypothetical protein